jgi:6-phosphogluconolactonase
VTELTTCPDPESVADRAAALIERRLARAVQERGRAHLALSGGTTPRRTYELLGPAVADWSGIEVWFADERCVAPEDRESNYRMAAETLLEPAAIASESVHRMEGELGPRAGAERYAAELHTLAGAGGELPVLDVIVLGIGPDGHVASLFPRAAELSAPPDELCLGVRSAPKPPPERITLTLAVLRAARSCVLLATGPEKARAVAGMLGEPSPEVPASLLRRERLTVLLDDAAAPPP